jgi:hypothetical protein
MCAAGSDQPRCVDSYGSVGTSTGRSPSGTVKANSFIDDRVVIADGRFNATTTVEITDESFGWQVGSTTHFGSNGSVRAILLRFRTRRMAANRESVTPVLSDSKLT